jgi:hypothetical protein
MAKQLTAKSNRTNSRTGRRKKRVVPIKPGLYSLDSEKMSDEYYQTDNQEEGIFDEELFSEMITVKPTHSVLPAM